MKKTVFILVFILLFSFCCAKETEKQGGLYSAEYFNDLINAAEIMREQREGLLDEDEMAEEEIYYEDEIISEDIEPFHLRIEQGIDTPIYKDTFKKVDSKTIIPITKRFSVVQDTLKTRNKYNSTDYKILAGVEYQPVKFLNFSSGLETNFRGLDQNPYSRKVYFSPVLKLGDRVSVKFHNKMNVQSYSSDHDISLNISPFKSKIMDFGVYSGLTRRRDGSVSESINFSTNFYF